MWANSWFGFLAMFFSCGRPLRLSFSRFFVAWQLRAILFVCVLVLCLFVYITVQPNDTKLTQRNPTLHNSIPGGPIVSHVFQMIVRFRHNSIEIWNLANFRRFLFRTNNTRTCNTRSCCLYIAWCECMRLWEEKGSDHQQIHSQLANTSIAVFLLARLANGCIYSRRSMRRVLLAKQNK